MEYFLLVPLLVFIFFFHKCFFSPSNTQKRLLPPSPTKLPIIGNLHQLGSLPHRSLHKLSKKYGPLMLLHFGSKPVLVTSSVDAARDIMKTHNLVWSNRPKSSMANGLFYGSKDVGFCPYGEYWRQIRSVTVLHLLSNKRVQSYRHVREEEISNMIDKIRQQCDSVIDLRDVLSCMTNNIISRVNIGRTYNEGESGIALKAYLEEILLLAGVFNIGDYIPWLKWLNKINGLDSRVKKVAKGLDAFLESENSINGGLDHTEIVTLIPSSLYSPINQVISATHAAMLLNSASAELLDSVSCFFDFQEIRPPPNSTIYPVTDLLVSSMHPSQSHNRL
ncbi:hypothetical protein MTR67_014711 [Solanum verrucosum]|uniref:Uncharacterized protein n=1 Tax=Solanum verrucosum TaxID=315347 RepID=A0AAF0QIN8_SOLVR|nr:hypothetical protein MTR67_014711 [Solanum verrucosum]